MLHRERPATRIATQVADCWNWIWATPDTAGATAKNLSGDEIHSYGHALLGALPWPADRGSDRNIIVAVTSSFSGEGVTTMATLCAVAAARSGMRRVLLVDANVVRPNVDRILGLSRKTAGWDEPFVEHQRGTIHATKVEGLHALPIERFRQSNREAVIDHIAQVLPGLKQEFDLIVVDMPPTCEPHTAKRLFGIADGVVLVVEDERVPRDVAVRTEHDLRQADANLIGVALNKRNRYIPNWLHQTL